MQAASFLLDNDYLRGFLIGEMVSSERAEIPVKP